MKKLTERTIEAKGVIRHQFNRTISADGLQLQAETDIVAALDDTTAMARFHPATKSPVPSADLEEIPRSQVNLTYDPADQELTFATACKQKTSHFTFDIDAATRAKKGDPSARVPQRSESFKLGLKPKELDGRPRAPQRPGSFITGDTPETIAARSKKKK